MDIEEKRKKHRNYMRKYYQKNTLAYSKLKIRNKVYREENKEIISQKQKRYREQPENKKNMKEYLKSYYQKHKQQIKLRSQQRYENNKELLYQQLKKRRETEEGRILHNKHNKKWRDSKKGKSFAKAYRNENKRHLQKLNNLWKKNQRKNNPFYRLNDYIRREIWFSLNKQKNNMHWEGLVGYTLEDLKQHLEKQFKDGMNWNNYGPYWHIDHRIPQSWFSFESYEDKGFKECWSLDNLQPKKAYENRNIKKNKYTEPTLNQMLKMEV